jgi:outer membrane receptor for Fe3+-dicitrate
LSAQIYNDKQISDEKEDEAVLSPPDDEQKFRFEEDILAICKRIRLIRGNPLLIMYYPDIMGRIVDDDIATVYEQFRRRGFSYTGKKIPYWCKGEE